MSDTPTESMLDDRIAELERENAALRADNQAAHALVLDLRTKENSERTLAVKLEKDNAALRADKERLDWLQNGGNAVDDVLYDMNVQIDFDVRAAIDAASKEVQS